MASSIWVRKETSSVVKDLEEMNESLALELKKKKGGIVCAKGLHPDHRSQEEREVFLQLKGLPWDPGDPHQ